MAGTSAAATKRSETPATITTVKSTTQQRQQIEEISSNPVYQILMSPDTLPEQKRDELAAYLADATKEKIVAYQAFEEYTQNVRQTMAEEITKLTDTEAFSELQGVYKDLNEALLDFEEKMKPLTDIIDAVYTLRTNDKTLDVFKEIQRDRKADEIRETKRNEIQQNIDQTRAKILSAQANIAALSQQKTFFGFGNIKESARQQISAVETKLNTESQNLTSLAKEAADLEGPANLETTLGQFTEQKAKLRELLDLSSDTHKQRQRELVNAALDYTKITKERIGNVREHFGRMSNQIDNLYDANGRMTAVYAIMSEAVQAAEKTNQARREELSTELSTNPTEVSLVASMKHDEELRKVENHIDVLDKSGAKAAETYADLTTQTIRINTMRAANQDQIAMARDMHTRGVAGVADRLSTVLQAVSGAALAESAAMAKDNLNTMMGDTNRIAQQEVIRVAMGVSELNRDVTKAIDDLGAYGTVVKNSTNIVRGGLTELRSKLDQMRELAQGIQGDIKESGSVTADVAAGYIPQQQQQPQQPKLNSAFGGFGNV